MGLWRFSQANRHTITYKPVFVFFQAGAPNILYIFGGSPTSKLDLSRSGRVGSITKITAVECHTVEAGISGKKEFSGGEKEIIFD